MRYSLGKIDGPARAAGALLLVLFARAVAAIRRRTVSKVMSRANLFMSRRRLAGQLETLSVQRGQQVTTGQPLFALDETAGKGRARANRGGARSL